MIDPSYPLASADEAADGMKVPANLLVPITRAMTLLVSALYSPRPALTIDHFLEEAVQRGFMDNDDRSAVAAFFARHLDAHGKAISAAIHRDRASVFVAPAFSGFQATTDVRFVDGADGLVALPISLVTIQTDVEGEDLVFQMTLRDAAYIRKRLDSVIRRLGKLRDKRLENGVSDG